MNYTVEMYSKTSGICLGVLNLDPRDYLEYSDSDEAEEAIVASLPCPEFPEDDENCNDLTDVDIDIPDEFWRDWDELKSEQTNVRNQLRRERHS